MSSPTGLGEPEPGPGVVAAHDAAGHCHCVARHHPAPMELHRHHVHPLGEGGPDVAANLVWLCPTAHANVHELLRLIKRRGGRLSWTDALAAVPEPLNRYAFTLAHEGWRRMQAQQAPGG